jgi:ABC-2 type transport system permease protein
MSWTLHARTLHAEWTKLRTVGGTGWLLLAVVVLTAAVGPAVAGSATCHVAGGCGQDPAKLSLTGVYLAELAELGPAKPGRSSQVWSGLVRLLFLLAG